MQPGGRGGRGAAAGVNPGGRGGAARGGNGAPPVRKPVVKPPWKGPLDEAPSENKPPAAAYVQESLTATLPRFHKAVHVGDRVIDKHSKREGICLYIGPADFAKGKEVSALV